MLSSLPHSLLSRLDFVAAAGEEIAQPVDLLPSRIVEHSLRGHEAEYGGFIKARVSHGFDLQPGATVWVPKPGHLGRYRPITALGLRDRVLLRALTNELSRDIPPFDRSFHAQQMFQQRPLETDAPYIVIADVSSFYFFIDHELLASRVVDLTARADTAEATREVLDGLLGRPYGLPQNFGPSAPLSEVFIAPVERRLLRSGIMTFRANDDFRLCAGSWGEALQALERLQEEVSQVGLDLNGDKSWILKRDTYASNLALADEYLATALESVDDDLPEIDPYTGAPVEDEAEEEDADEDWEGDAVHEQNGDDSSGENALSDAAMAAAFSNVFHQAASQRLSDLSLNGFVRSANRQAMTVSLVVLTRLGSDAAVDVGAQMVAVDPLLTRDYVRYLRALPAKGTDAADRVQAALERFRGHAPFWTQAWLVDVLLDPRAELTGDLVDWLRALLKSRAPAVLRMRAALALTFHGKLSAQAVAEMLDELPAAARPDAVAAMALAGSASSATAAAAFPDDRLLRWVFEFASEHREDPGALL